jgi:hypothetical protein
MIESGFHSAMYFSDFMKFAFSQRINWIDYDGVAVVETLQNVKVV